MQAPLTGDRKTPTLLDTSEMLDDVINSTVADLGLESPRLSDKSEEQCSRSIGDVAMKLHATSDMDSERVLYLEQAAFREVSPSDSGVSNDHFVVGPAQVGEGTRRVRVFG